MLGSYAIVGAHLPMAVGAAWSAKLRGTGQVAVAFFGDGATNIGAFHEALNLAAVWQLPVLFVCENNLYMEYTPIGDVTAVANPAADRAPAYGMPAEVIDGNDVLVVHEAPSGGRPRGPGPATGRRCIEARTYRHYGHSRDRPGDVPPGRGGRATGCARDPLTVAAGRSWTELRRQPAVRRDADDRARQTLVADAVAAAKAAPPADPAEAFTDVWADGSATWRT